MRAVQVGLMVGASVLALGLAAPAGAQTAGGAQNDTAVSEVVVTGVRESLRSAQAIKRSADQIVDSVQAQDIGKLPDANTTEALQRITGVQIQRRYGEGATDFDHRTQPAVTVRGLTQVQNFLDGRAVYSASGGRAFDLEGVPPELLSGIDVYKNAPANIIEGGVGGAVNLRTRKPFDSAGRVLSATVRGNYYDRVGKDGGSISGLYSNRWDTSAGEMGFLINAVLSKSHYRQDGLLAGPFDTVPAGSIANAPANAQVPYGFEIYDDTGDRKRLGIATAFQWKPSDDLLLTAQYQRTKYWFNRTGAYYYDYNNRSNVRNAAGAVTSYGTDPLPGAAFTFNDEGYATKGALRNQTFETGRYDQQLWSQSQNFTLNAAWRVSDRLKANFDAQYLKSYYNADRNGHVLSLYTQSGQTGLTTPHKTIVDFDLTGKYPRFEVRDPTLLSDPANYTTPYVADSLQRNDAETYALTGDFEYDFEGGFFDKLRGGARYSDNNIDLRGTWHGVCITSLGADPNCSAPAGTPLVPLSAHPQLAMKGPSKDWFDGNTVKGGLLYPAFPAGDGVWAQTKALYALLGATTKDSFAPGDLNSQTEKTYTGWAVADYDTEIGGVAVDGGIGVRVIKTQATSKGTQFNADGTSKAIDVDNSYTRVLPSFNLRAKLTDSLQARLAYSKGLARPNFDQLSTNLTLNNPNQVNPVTGHPSASSGNPTLHPIESDNYDLTAEWYFSSTGSLTAGAFYKKVDGFLAGGTVTGSYNGVVYDVGTVVNSGKGTVKGIELGYQQFFDFLPGLLSGLGLQANYTYVDSSVSNPFATAGSSIPTQVPLEKLSKNSYNLVGLYEKGPVSARVAYNWRSAYLDQTTGSGANGIPQYAKPYASLDASISYDVNDHVAVSFDAVNINNRMNVLYIGTPAAPLQYQLNDRRYGFAVRVTY
ncbi:TonB-dependent receptor [Caulobacter sp. RL271]|jgi:TonB-dependent receptor|uniref:TonB-dependent receptor n=1 Tax=Caulobacter segnis TaxID=88688 RepID=A0ABY4ZX32_9CAUL|nr:TonB-dependent receptor [Caulobacter segnis]USQ97402.1 TonB-dependent receptor [Caulobacter segnis]